ncbi:MAG: MBL fold metallo-hydrolase [Pseudomonadota bacterium]
MASEPKFRTQFDPRHGEAVEVAPGIVRVVAPNSSAYTFTGTNSYLVGRDRLLLVDPGPGEAKGPGHAEALKRAVADRPVEAIIITHTHWDHTELAAAVAEQFGAPVTAFGPHIAARQLRPGESNPLASSNDYNLQIDRMLAHGEIVGSDMYTLEAIHTPGHTENHICLAVRKRGAPTDFILSGDHVMGWNTTIVAPVDGHMGHYIESLDHLLERPESTYFPGHGGRVEQAHTLVRAIRHHRIMRERAILEQAKKGNPDPHGIAAILYPNIAPNLVGAAALNVQAHLDHLVETGRFQP